MKNNKKKANSKVGKKNKQNEQNEDRQNVLDLLDRGNEFGISLIMITLGSKGVFYRRKGNVGEGDLHGIVPAEEVDVCDTNGAGDTFLGAVLAQIANNGSIPAERVQLEAMLTFANRAAALTCSRPGAIPAMPTLAELGE